MPKPALKTVPAPAPDGILRARILDAARAHLFAYGYSALTMDELARELGISKKTVYLHFPGKDAIVAEILDQFAAHVRGMADALFADTSLTYTVKFRRFVEEMVIRFSRVSPHLLRDLERSAPGLYEKLEELRSKNIPLVFGKLIRQGQAAGMVRSDIDPAFAVEFWRPAVQSLMHPGTLERLRLKPEEVFEKAVALFFGGLLAPAGRKDYEKQFSA